MADVTWPRPGRRWRHSSSRSPLSTTASRSKYTSVFRGCKISGFQTFRTRIFSYPGVYPSSLYPGPNLDSNLSSNPKLTSNPNINTNPNPNSRYLTLALCKNAGYETPGYANRFGYETSGTRISDSVGLTVCPNFWQLRIHEQSWNLLLKFRHFSSESWLCLCSLRTKRYINKRSSNELNILLVKIIITELKNIQYAVVMSGWSAQLCRQCSVA